MHKHLLFLVLVTLVFSCNSYKLPPTKYYIDVDGKEIGEQEFDLKWRNYSPKYAGVKYVAKDSGMVFKLSHQAYETYQIAYKPFHKNMEELTDKKLSDSTIFMIEYTFKDDYCTSEPPNDWTNWRLDNRYQYIKAQIKIAEKEIENMVYAKLFEKEIKLPEFSEKQQGIFFVDRSGFFRKKVFKNPTLCGSFAIIKPNGEMLVRNGEYGIQGMADHIKAENWEVFFPDIN